MTNETGINERMCGHPDWLVRQTWNPQTQRLEITQRRPATKMVGPCKHNMICPVCGFGWGSAPDPCAPSSGEQR